MHAHTTSTEEKDGAGAALISGSILKSPRIPMGEVAMAHGCSSREQGLPLHAEAVVMVWAQARWERL